MSFALNTREIQALVLLYQNILKGKKLERLFVPKRPWGFSKNEWCFRFRDRTETVDFVVSLQVDHAVFYLLRGGTLQSKPEATQSAFGQQLQKYIRRKKLISMEAIEHDRLTILWFEEVGLGLHLIPKRPRGWLFKKREQGMDQIRFEIIGGMSSERPLFFELKPEKGAWSEQPIQADLLEAMQNPYEFGRRCETEILNRPKASPSSTERNAKPAILKPLHKQPYRDWAEALKQSLFETSDSLNDTIKHIPNKKKLPPKKLMEHYYRLAKKLDQVEKVASQPDISPLNLTELPRDPLFNGFQITVDSYRLWVGKNAEQNRKLTFKLARGNDLWFHIKGRPSAHGVLFLSDHLQNGRPQISHEIILRAASFFLYLGGGKKWGKTEVDYTFRKYVKPISGSNQVLYTQNKTMIIEPMDPKILSKQ